MRYAVNATGRSSLGSRLACRDAGERLPAGIGGRRSDLLLGGVSQAQRGDVQADSGAGQRRSGFRPG
jgi:hypothetical protein